MEIAELCCLFFSFVSFSFDSASQFFSLVVVCCILNFVVFSLPVVVFLWTSYRVVVQLKFRI